MDLTRLPSTTLVVPRQIEETVQVTDSQRAGYQSVPDDLGGKAGRGWWDANASEYLDDHGAFLGDTDFCWCPEGLRESELHVLGPEADLAGRAVLEIGSGAAQCARWLVQRGARVVATDVSAGMLAASRRLDARSGTQVPIAQADARALPFASGSFDAAFTSYGALPFVPDAAAVHDEVYRCCDQVGGGPSP